MVDGDDVMYKYKKIFIHHYRVYIYPIKGNQLPHETN